MFGKKKEAEATKSVERVEMGKTELHVNPPPNVTLERKEKRLERVKLFLASDACIKGSNKELQMSEVKRRLEMEIKLQRGDF